jgi:hypothetical protein
MKHLLLMALVGLGLVLAAEPYQVAFETTECSGETGFATVDISTIDKIKNAGCSIDGKPLKMLLVQHNGSYNTFTMREEEAKAVMQDVKTYNRAQLQLLERSNAVIIAE